MAMANRIARTKADSIGAREISRAGVKFSRIMREIDARSLGISVACFD